MKSDVRAEVASDFGAVCSVLNATFGRTSEAGLVDRLRARPDVIALVGAVEDRVVGHVIFTPIEVIGARPSRPAMAVGLLAVHPEFRSQGIGGRLVTEGLEECRRRGAGLVFVIGPAAFYRRVGFVPAAPLGIRSRWRAPAGSFQVVELVPGEVAQAHGVVRFPREFA